MKYRFQRQAKGCAIYNVKTGHAVLYMSWTDAAKLLFELKAGMQQSKPGRDSLDAEHRMRTRREGGTRLEHLARENVECPSCGAEPGRSCTSKAGKDRANHPRRVAIWAEAQPRDRIGDAVDRQIETGGLS